MTALGLSSFYLAEYYVSLGLVIELYLALWLWYQEERIYLL